MSARLSVRRFEIADAAALAALFHSSVREAGSRDYTPAQVAAWSPAPPTPEEYLRRADDRMMFVAVDASGLIVGYGDLEPDGHIDHLYRRPDRIGTGVGTVLLTAIMAAARTAGLDRLHVEASEAARRLLTRCGFVVDARNDFVLRGVAIHNYSMSKRLS